MKTSSITHPFFFICILFSFTRCGKKNDPPIEKVYRNNVTIQYYLTQDGGHAWPGGLPGSANGDTPSVVINANDLLWDFFQQYKLPG